MRWDLFTAHLFHAIPLGSSGCYKYEKYILKGLQSKYKYGECSIIKHNVE